MFRVAFSRIKKDNRQIKCSLMGKWLNKLWLMHSVKYSAVMRKNYTHTHTHTYEILCVCIYMLQKDVHIVKKKQVAEYYINIKVLTYYKFNVYIFFQLY